MRDPQSPRVAALERCEPLPSPTGRPYLLRLWFFLLAAVIALAAAVPGHPGGLQWAPPSRPNRPALSIEATLRGYFLTPQGQLELRSLSLAEKARRPHETIRPVPSGYYLAIAAKSSQSPIVQADVMTLQGHRQLISLRLKPPSLEVRIPQEAGSWLGVRPEEGLAFQVVLRLADGQRVEAPLHPHGCRLLPMAPLRVNWLDLVRIEEARRLLRALGDEILPGLRADDVPIALLGEDGQGVLINHPHPPRGFRRYNDPLPTGGRAEVGPLSSAASLPHTLKLQGEPTAIFPYDPAWFALPEAPMSKRDEGEATNRLEAIIHEICHVAWLRCTGKDLRANPEAVEGPSVQAAAVEEAEREALAEALDWVERTPQKALTLLCDYLALREHRRELDAASSALVDVQEVSETTEGFAYFAMWRAGEVAEGRYDFPLLRRTDPFLEDFRPEEPHLMLEPDEELQGLWAPKLSLNTYPSYYGACQAKLIHALHPEELLAAWQRGTLLRQALSRIAGYEGMSAQERGRLKREALARWQCAEREASLRQALEQEEAAQWRAAGEALQGQGVLLRVQADLFPAGQRRSPKSPWRFSNAYAFITPDIAVECTQPCLVRSTLTRDEGRLELQAVLSNDELLIIRRAGQSTRIQAGKVVIEAGRVRLRGGRSPSLITVECRPAAGAAGSNQQKEDKKMKLGKFTVVPLLAGLLASPGLAQLVHHEVTFTLNGVLLNADTGQQQNVTLDLLAEAENPTGNWYLIEGQTYSAKASMTDASYSRVSRVALYDPNGALIHEVTANPPTTRLTAAGTFRAVQTMKPNYKIHVTHQASCEWGLMIILEPGQPPQPQGGTINVVVLDGGQSTWGRLRDATVAVWPDGHPEQKQQAVTNDQGLATFANMAAGQYITEVRGPGHRCVIRRGPYQLRKRAQLNEVVVSWPHCGINGKVWFKNARGQTVSGQADKVKVELFQGSQFKGGLVVGAQQQPDGSYP